MSFFNFIKDRTETRKSSEEETHPLIEISNIPKNITKKCTHYKNNLLVYADCCNEYFECHICHNEEKGHILNRPLINKIKCINCNSINKIGTHCTNCKIEFALNHCKICKIWCSNLKNIYHCHKCGRCKVGEKSKYYHCDECNLCYSYNCKDIHICKIVNNNKMDNCPICLNKILDNMQQISVLRCSHLMHKECYNSLIKNSNENGRIPSCTLCKKSLHDPIKYESIFDRAIENYQMPENYNNWISEILCNDCNEKTNATYHIMYHKCSKCKSYNTNVCNVIKNN